MAGIFDTGIFDSGVFDHPVTTNGTFSHPPFDTGIFDHAGTVGTFDTGIFDRNIFDNILGPVQPSQTLGGGPGFALSFRQERDWQKIRKARDEIRAALEDATSGPKKQRQAAAAKAAAAIKDVASLMRGPSAEAWADVLSSIEALQAYLAGIEMMKAEQARQAAEQWAAIEAELLFQQKTEEELAIVLALAL